MKRLGRLEAVAFMTGFSLMAYELAAARLLAPWIGSSMYVWTSVIGVIVAALSIGYWMGGKLADARHHASDVAWMTLAAALGVVLSRLMGNTIMDFIVTNFVDPRAQGLWAAILLFAPASFVLGAISPYLAKLNIRSLQTAGRSVASLGALNSVGGIVGTFVTGFYLFGYVGATETLVLVALLLIAASWLLVPREQLGWRLAATLGLMLLAIAPPFNGLGGTDIDTPSAHYRVIEGLYEQRQVRGLVTGPSGVQSAVFMDGSNDLVFWYTREMARLALEQQPERVLMLGGGAFTLPQYLAHALPDAQIDVVEIDPELEPISEQYFGYSQPDNVRLYFDDARSYLNKTDKQYDLVLVDVYGDVEAPFTMMTEQYGRAIAAAVEPDGMLVANIIAGLHEGPCRELFAVFDAVYRQAFSYAQYSNEDNIELIRGNHIVAYARDALNLESMLPLEPLHGQLYTDNYAPAERLYFACQQG